MVYLSKREVGERRFGAGKKIKEGRKGTEEVTDGVHLGIFDLAIQLCEPVGGTAHIGLFNLSSCAVSRPISFFSSPLSTPFQPPLNLPHTPKSISTIF